VIDRFAPSNRYPDKQQLIYFDVRVRNQGDAPAGGFTVEVGGNTMVPDLERVQGLAPGEFVKILFGPTNVGDANIGRYVVQVDSKNEVAESNESDNRVQTTVEVRHPFPRPPRRP
jgi:subtilase family serine protease